jgi:uncharacterized iron-regulated membrane protein
MAQPQRTCWQQWLQHPQGLWFRKALFQVHLWVGVGIAIYVLAISVSGSAIVYQRELMRHSRRAMVLTESGRRMSVDELTAYVQRAYPAYEVDSVLEASQADRPDDVVLERGNKRIERLFDPNSGADMGDPEPGINHAIGGWPGLWHSQECALRTFLLSSMATLSYDSELGVPRP